MGDFLPSTAHPLHDVESAALISRGFPFSSVVGYQNKGFDAKFNYVCNTFVPVGMERSEMTLGDIKPNDAFVNSSIQFLTTGGATAKINVDGLGTVKATFIYLDEDDAEDGAGWYCMADDDGEYNQNDRVIPFGDAYCVDRSTGEPDAALVFAGEVQTTPVTKSFEAKFNYIGNCCPKDITLGDITPNAAFVNSSIQFLTTGGATAKITVAGLGTPKATFIYLSEDDAEDGAGWYCMADDDGEYNQNDRVIPAGSAFCVDRSTGEPEATLTIPAAL